MVEFKIVNGRIPKIQAKRGSRYSAVIESMISHPKKVHRVKGGSASGLRNAIKRMNGDKADKFVVAERKGKLYAVYQGD